MCVGEWVSLSVFPVPSLSSPLSSRLSSRLSSPSLRPLVRPGSPSLFSIDAIKQGQQPLFHSLVCFTDPSIPLNAGSCKSKSPSAKEAYEAAEGA